MITDIPVSAVFTGTGHHQVTDARKPGKRILRCSKPHSQTLYFMKASRDEGRLGIVTQTGTINNPCGYRHDILDRSAYLNPDNIVIEINSKHRRHKCFLDDAGSSL